MSVVFMVTSVVRQVKPVDEDSRRERLKRYKDAALEATS